jgi:hypothetical protein
LPKEVSNWFEYIDPLLPSKKKKCVRAIVSYHKLCWPRKKYDVISEVTEVSDHAWTFKSMGETGVAYSKEEAIFLSDLILKSNDLDIPNPFFKV